MSRFKNHLCMIFLLFASLIFVANVSHAQINLFNNITLETDEDCLAGKDPFIIGPGGDIDLNLQQEAEVTVRYCYTLTNNTGFAMTNIVATTDNGTAVDTSDDITFGTDDVPSTLPAGASVSWTRTRVVDLAALSAEDCNIVSSAKVVFGHPTINGEVGDQATIIALFVDCPPNVILTCDELAALGYSSINELYAAIDDITDANELTTANDLFGRPSNPGNCCSTVFPQATGVSLIDVGCTKSITRSWVIDISDCENDPRTFEVICTQTITLIDTTAPTFLDCPDDILDLPCNAPVPPAPPVTAVDDCGDVTVELVETDEIVDCIRTITRTWTAEDICGNTATCVQLITIPTDNEPPTFDNCPIDTTLACNAEIPAVPIVTASDNCDDDVSVSYVETPNQTDCALILTRTWTAEDDCGNTAECVQVITIPTDEVPPVFENCPADVTLACNADLPPPDQVTAFDLCDDDVAVSFGEEDIIDGCVRTITRTWIATDDCENEATCVQVITIPQDEVAPTFDNCPSDVTLACNADLPPADLVTASDNCDTDVAVSLTETSVVEDCAVIYTRTWTAEDECGNTAECVQVITIPTDAIPPTFDNCPADMTLACNADLPEPEVVTASDNCDLEVAVLMTETSVVEDCAVIYTRIWTAEDECGNTAECVQVITIPMDAIPPTFDNCPADMLVECGDSIPDAPFVTASDNCDLDVTVTYVEEVGEMVDCSQIITRTWTATDDCGNTAVCVQVITVELERGAISGYKTDADTGAGIAGWMITLLDCDGNVIASTSTDADGYYAFTDLPSGCYQVEEETRDGWMPEGSTISGEIAVDCCDLITDVNFVNRMMAEGCTPGYWKNNAVNKDAVAWLDTAYMPDMLVSTVFGFPPMVDLNGDGEADTLLDALNYGGGGGDVGALRILLRAAVASLLNASSTEVNFAWTVDQIIASVQDAVVLGRSAMLSLAAELDADNNAGCPINQDGDRESVSTTNDDSSNNVRPSRR